MTKAQRKTTAQAVKPCTYKTLAKIGKGRFTLPILKTIRVSGGRTLATDLDLWIEDDAPEGLKEGCYSAHGFEQGLYSDSKLPIADYPLDSGRGELLGVVNVPAAWVLDSMAWVSKAMSTEATRYYLNGVLFVNPDMAGKTGIVATDGHRLHVAEFGARWPITGCDFQQGMILPSAAVKLLIALVEEKKPASVRVSFHKNGFVFEVGSAVMTSKLVDATFPDWQRVFPGNIVGSTPFDPRELITPLKEAKILGKIHGSRSLPVRISTGNKLHLVINEAGEKSWPFSSVIPAEHARDGIGFNLKYLSEACAGILHYQDYCGPVRIDGFGQQTVLMPLRI